MKRKVGIVGSRDYNPLHEVIEYVRSLPPDTIVVSGGAVGVDKAAENEARRLGLEVEVIPANWTLGPAAGFIRNIKVAETIDELVAFWDGKSKGTAHTIREALRRKKKVVVRISPYKAFSREAGGDGKMPPHL